MIPFLKNNSVIFIGVIAWFIAQLIKFIIELSINKKINWKRFLESGGMPSSHSAFVCSVAMGIGFREGFASSLFALAFTIAIIVMYDAMGVRRAAGEQAEAINDLREKLTEEQEEEETYPEWEKPLREALGHKPTEVISGAVLGIAISCLAI